MIRNTDSTPNGPDVPLHPLRPGNVIFACLEFF